MGLNVNNQFKFLIVNIKPIYTIKVSNDRITFKFLIVNIKLKTVIRPTAKDKNLNSS